MMMNKVRKGYSFIEAIVAISVLSALIVISLNATTSSADTENINKDFLVAELLAQEGIELIWTLYNTNLLKFGEENIEQCAFMLPTFTGNANNCNTSIIKLDNGNGYIIYNNLLNKNVEVDQFIGINEISDDNAFDERFRLYIHEPSGMYVNGAPTAGLTPTKFYRGVFVSTADGTKIIEVNVSFIRSGGLPTTITQTFNLE
jgi:type II secretory pathway pseudopilin PulG